MAAKTGKKRLAGLSGGECYVGPIGAVRNVRGVAREIDFAEYGSRREYRKMPAGREAGEAAHVAAAIVVCALLAGRIGIRFGGIVRRGVPVLVMAEVLRRLSAFMLAINARRSPNGLERQKNQQEDGKPATHGGG
ncbi:MAG: hypothetical protein LBI68_03430 [Azoarcus sp.]|jgi:hypothetical protein|nr:hypothetical protein [Azoarcus sp.]